jgi:hypothetical protein
MLYYQAVRIWNERKGHAMYCSPKKGSQEHKEVLDIQKGTDKQKEASSRIAAAIKRKMTSQFEPEKKLSYDVIMNELNEYIPDYLKEKEKSFKLFKLILKKAIENANKETTDNFILISGVGINLKREGMDKEKIKNMNNELKKENIVNNIKEVMTDITTSLRARPLPTVVKASSILTAAVKRATTK